MAVVNYKKPTLSANVQIPKGVQVVLWEGMDTGDTATPYDCPQYARKSMQAVGGSANVQGTVVPEGTDTFVDLTSDGSQTATTTSTSLTAIHEQVYRVRPDVTTGSDVDVYLLISTEARG